MTETRSTCKTICEHQRQHINNSPLVSLVRGPKRMCYLLACARTLFVLVEKLCAVFILTCTKERTIGRSIRNVTRNICVKQQKRSTRGRRNNSLRFLLISVDSVLGGTTTAKTWILVYGYLVFANVLKFSVETFINEVVLSSSVGIADRM